MVKPIIMGGLLLASIIFNQSLSSKEDVLRRIKEQIVIGEAIRIHKVGISSSLNVRSKELDNFLQKYGVDLDAIITERLKPKQEPSQPLSIDEFSAVIQEIMEKLLENEKFYNDAEEKFNLIRSKKIFSQDVGKLIS